MNKKELNKLEQRKKELELEIARLQTEVDVSIGELKDGINDLLSPKELIKKYPLKSITISLLTGYMLANSTKNKGSINSNGLKAMLSFELKRLVTQKLISLLTEFIENKTLPNNNLDQ